MSKYIQLIQGAALKQAKAAALGAPSAATDGLNIAKLSRKSGAGYGKAMLTIWADGACTLTNAVLWGFDPVQQLWGPFQSLIPAWSALPASIDLSATKAYHVYLDQPTVFSALALVGTLSANNVGYNVTPIDQLH